MFLFGDGCAQPALNQLTNFSREIGTNPSAILLFIVREMTRYFWTLRSTGKVSSIETTMSEYVVRPPNDIRRAFSFPPGEPE